MKVLTDKYSIDEKLGEGGMGAVFRGEMTGFRGFARTVAIKMLHDVYDGQKLARARFAREARICGALTHRNVVPVLDFDRSDTGEPFLVMEYVDGVDLRAFMASANLSIDASVYIAGEVLCALDYAHKQGVIHRDVKPRNVLISRSGDVMLTDFGLAKFCSHNSSSQARKSGVKGTVGYIAPEVARHETVDHRAELFMVGVMLYELVTGQLPFGKEMLSETIRRMSEGTPEEPRALRSEVPEPLNALILRLLRVQPDERLDSADVVRRELSTCADSARGAEEIAALAHTDDEAPAHALTLAKRADPRATEHIELFSGHTENRKRSRWRLAPVLLAVAAVALLAGGLFIGRYQARSADALSASASPVAEEAIPAEPEPGPAALTCDESTPAPTQTDSNSAQSQPEKVLEAADIVFQIETVQPRPRRSSVRRRIQPPAEPSSQSKIEDTTPPIRPVFFHGTDLDSPDSTLAR